MNRAAIIITSRTKEHPDFNDVPGVDNDGQQVYTFFHNAGYAVQLVRDESASQVKAVVDEVVGQLPAGSLLVVYYAGHGHVVNGQHVLICPKATRKRLQTFHEVIQVEDLRLATDVKGLHRAIILDCCRDSPYRNVTRGTGGFSGLQDETALRDIGRSEAGREGATGVLQDRGASWHLMCGCSKDEVAPEIPRQRRGLFTTAFVDEMKAQAQSAGPVRLDETLCVHIGKRMAAIAAENEMHDFPTPWHEGSGEMPVMLGEAGAGGSGAPRQGTTLYSGGAAVAMQPAGPVGRQGAASAPAGGFATTSGRAEMPRAGGAGAEARMEAARLESSIARLRQGRALYFIVGGTSLLLILFMLMFTPVMVEGGGSGVEAASRVSWMAILVPLMAFGSIGWALSAAIKRRELARATHLEEPARRAGTGAAAANSDAESAAFDASLDRTKRHLKKVYIVGGVCAILFLLLSVPSLFAVWETGGDGPPLKLIILVLSCLAACGVVYARRAAIRKRTLAHGTLMGRASGARSESEPWIAPQEKKAPPALAADPDFARLDAAVRVRQYLQRALYGVGALAGLCLLLLMACLLLMAERRGLNEGVGGVIAVVFGLPVVTFFLLDSVIKRSIKTTKTARLLHLKVMAERGSADAQFELGRCYLRAVGTIEDFPRAARWFRQAAEQGYAPGQYALGQCFYFGNGYAEDMGEAVKWYRLAAEQGYAGGQCALGWCCQQGEGVAMDKAAAVAWYRKAAAQEEPHAMFNLARCYEAGEGVEQSRGEALEWYQKAAAGGHPGGKVNVRRLEG